MAPYTCNWQTQPMQNCSFDRSRADTVLFFAYEFQRESGYTGPVVIDAADTYAYVAAADLRQQLPGMIYMYQEKAGNDLLPRPAS